MTNYRVVPARTTNIGLVVLVLVCLAVGLGFYLGWFRVSEQREPITHRVNVNLSVDGDKIKHDVHAATEKTEQKASQLSGKVKQEARDLNQRSSPSRN